MTDQLSPSGIYQPHNPVARRDDQHDQTGFDTLWDVQGRDFWYRGRHRFLPKALDQLMLETHSLRWVIDLGEVSPIGVSYSC